jgi:hypothetical protein
MAASFQPILMLVYGWVLVSTTQVFAAGAPGYCGNECKLDSPGSLGIPTITVGDAAKSIIGILSFIAAVLSAIFIIMAGIKYITSSGNSQRTEGAKQTLTYAVIGLIVSVLAFSIVNFIAAKAP